jgi:single-strand DNA-binding protein
MYLNRLTLIGFTGGDAETKSGNNGSTFTVFSVATKHSWKNVDGEWESRTEWHRCLVIWNWTHFSKPFSF